nr:uncharacterized protein CI109_005088 [Kwoniella shandongensis]KAA5526516.1 hypothetical protein CI109_005088 [Kwoniella shandongensis]
MAEPMDIDLSLDEIIARKARGWAQRVNHIPPPTHFSSAYQRSSLFQSSRSKSKSSRNRRKRSRSSKMDIDLTLDELIARRKPPPPRVHPNTVSITQPSRNIPYSRPVFHVNRPAPNQRRMPSRSFTIGVLTSDVTPEQVKDLIQSTIGPVQSVQIDSRGVAHVLLKKWQAWEVFDRFNGQWLDGTS